MLLRSAASLLFFILFFTTNRGFNDDLLVVFIIFCDSSDGSTVITTIYLPVRIAVCSRVPDWVEDSGKYDGATWRDGLLMYISISKVARPSQFGLPDKEVILVTKDGYKIRSYVMIQRGEEVAIQSPTVVCFHVSGYLVDLEYSNSCNWILGTYWQYGK